ncbi:MAG: hypothetical protein COX63_01280, partial [Candidatus Diapherotrites archaeon CG_4_10_14_0_2_um_filter_31_5]
MKKKKTKKNVKKKTASKIKAYKKLSTESAIKELEKLLTKPASQKRTFVTKEEKTGKKKFEVKTNLRQELGTDDELQELISPRRGIDLKILRYLEELPKEQFTALLMVEPTNYSKINYELTRLLINHTHATGLYIT